MVNISLPARSLLPPSAWRGTWCYMFHVIYFSPAFTILFSSDVIHKYNHGNPFIITICTFDQTLTKPHKSERFFLFAAALFRYKNKNKKKPQKNAKKSNIYRLFSCLLPVSKFLFGLHRTLSALNAFIVPFPNGTNPQHKASNPYKKRVACEFFFLLK